MQVEEKVASAEMIFAHVMGGDIGAYLVLESARQKRGMGHVLMLAERCLEHGIVGSDLWDLYALSEKNIDRLFSRLRLSPKVEGFLERFCGAMRTRRAYIRAISSLRRERLTARA